MVQESTLEELIENRHIILIHNDGENWWLQKSYVERGIKLVRRQELPPEAVVPTADGSMLSAQTKLRLHMT